MLDTLVDEAQSLGIPYRDNVMITRLLSDGDQVYGAAGYDRRAAILLMTGPIGRQRVAPLPCTPPFLA